MKRFVICAILAGLVVGLTGPAWTDGPLVESTGKLFGALLPENLPAYQVQVYENSGANAAFVVAQWGKIEPKNPGDGQPIYNYSGFDAQPLMATKKTKVLVADLTNPWASEVSPPEFLREQAQDFLIQMARHAYDKGFRYFWLRPAGYSSIADYASDLKVFYKIIKKAGKDTFVLAGPDKVYDIQQFYSAKTKDSFDVLTADVVSSNPKLGIDLIKLLKVRETMARNGDQDKKIFVVGVLGDQPDTQIENTYRSVLTKRDMYDPAWVLGAVATGKMGATPPKPFPPDIPLISFDGSLPAEGPVLNYVAGKPYKLSLKLNSHVDKEIKLNKFSVEFPDAGGLGINVKPVDTPKTVAPNGAATAEFTVTFSKEAAGRTVLVSGGLDYTIDGKDHFTDCYIPAMVTTELELTLLPQKVVLGISNESQTVGMSVINHMDSLYSSDVTLKPYSGIKTSVTEHKIVVDPFGLDAFVFKVEKEPRTAPGHYAIMVDVGDKISDWIAVDVALPIKKTAGRVNVDADLGEWKDMEPVKITTHPKTGAAQIIGKGWFAYDDSNLYAAFEIDDTNHVSRGTDKTKQDAVQIAFDPLSNGSQTPEGGFLPDDYEFVLQGTDKDAVVVRLVAPPGKALTEVPEVAFKFKNEKGKSYYEAAFPWAEIAPLDAKSKRYFGLSVLVNMTNGGPVEYAEWGGGLVPQVDPRAFLPAILVH